MQSTLSCLIFCYLNCKCFVLFDFIIYSGELKLPKECFAELGERVDWLEFAVFMNIRIYLLQPRKRKYLIKTLYCILLLLPQGNSFSSLLKRLNHVEILLKLDKSKKGKKELNE